VNFIASAEHLSNYHQLTFDSDIGDDS